MKLKKFVSRPNLPENKVGYVIMSDIKSNIVSELNAYGITVISSGRLNSITRSEAYHADMCICHIGGERFVASKNIDTEVKSKLESLGCNIVKSEHTVTAKRPSLNVCILGNKIICNTKIADKGIIEYSNKSRMSIINVNQGYTKCSSAVINENALITSDESIYKSCIKSHIDVLKISHGYIDLKGYDYGFIGGTCGLIAKDILAFCGDISLHKDYKNIKAFAASYNISLLSLSNEKLYDIGGILPILESE